MTHPGFKTFEMSHILSSVIFPTPTPTPHSASLRGHGPPSDGKLGAKCQHETGEGVKFKGHREQHQPRTLVPGRPLPCPFENPNPTTIVGLPHKNRRLPRNVDSRHISENSFLAFLASHFLN